MAKFCGYCGAPVDPDGTCPVCGHKAPSPLFHTSDPDEDGLPESGFKTDYFFSDADEKPTYAARPAPGDDSAPRAQRSAPAYPQPRSVNAPPAAPKKTKQPGSKKGVRIALIVLGAVALIALTVFLLDRFGVIDLFGNHAKVGEIYFHATEKAHVKKDEASDFYYADNELLVVARTGVKKRDMETVAKKHNAAVVGFIEVTGDYQLQFETPMTPAQLATEAAALTAEPQVETAAMNLVIPITKAPTAPERHDSDDGADPYWDMQLISAPEAWRVANENKADFSPVGIGLIANGDPSHADIPVAKRFFDGTGAEPHAVAVAAIMAADGTNADGYSGVYPYAKNNLYVASAEGMADAGVSVMWEKAALAQLLASGARVVNCGYGANENLDLTAAADTLGDFLNRMLGAGYDFLLVTDAGNTGSAVSYSTLNALPAAKYPQVAARVLTVGASDENGAPLSGVDGGVQLLAPGGSSGSGIYTASANGGFAFVGSDTAYGAPHASGAAALIWAADNNLSGDAVKNLLLSTRQSDRLLDVAAALQAALAGKGGTPALTPAEDTTEAARDLTVTIEPLDLSVTRDGHTFRVTYPQITVAGRDAVAGKINACFESERGMHEAAVLDPDTVSNMFAYTETSVTLYDDTSAEVVYQDENVLSIVFTNSMYHGGAHGIYGKRGFTFDLRTGELAGVTDLFNEPASEMLSTIRARIKATVREQTENRMSGEAADAYTLEQLNFWIDGNGELTVYIGVYEMASFADGDFEVPCGYTLSGGSPAAQTTEAPTTQAPTSGGALSESEALSLWREANNVYAKYTVHPWDYPDLLDPSDTYSDGYSTYIRVKGYDSFEELRTFLRQYFDEEQAFEFVTPRNSGYQEKDGKLYVCHGEIGTDGAVNVTPALKSADATRATIELTFDDEFTGETGVHAETELVLENGRWVFAYPFFGDYDLAD